VPVTSQEPDTSESTFTVLVAMAANAGIGVAKLFAGLLTGSSALLSEAAHSASDAGTEVLLLTALRRSERPADRVHPFGYGKERYFWSLIAAVAIFVSGAAFSIWEGVRTIRMVNEPLRHAWVNYAVLLVAFILEGTSFVRAVRHTRDEAVQRRRSARSYLRNPDDPTIKSVVLEDFAALVGILIATVGVALHQVTGNSVWDGVASLLIGALLVVAAFLLAQTCKGLLVGKQADPRLVRAIERTLEEQPEIIDVVDLVTMMVGTDRILVGARVDFVDECSSAQLEEACVRIDGLLRDRYTGLDEIFIQPVPREDPELRSRVLRRYGRTLAD
jgi:cation diffusion facilitator family transporter